MDIAVYLPDELGARAKEAGVKFSALLRQAVQQELGRREALEDATGRATTHELTVADQAGYVYGARLHGSVLVIDERTGTTAYVLEDGRLAVHQPAERDSDCRLFLHDPDAEDTAGDEASESEWLAQWLSEIQVVQAMARLGRRAVIDIGRRRGDGGSLALQSRVVPGARPSGRERPRRIAGVSTLTDGTVAIELNAANGSQDNGIDLEPNIPLPHPFGQTLVLRITAATVAEMAAAAGVAAS